MNIWDNQSNYIKCKKKLYNIAACMPPVGTVVVNILEQADVVQALGGRTYFTADEVMELKAQNHPMFNTLSQLASQGRIYTVSEAKNVVLAGTMGEMWVVDFNKLVNSYTTASGGIIKPEDLRTWCVVRTKPDVSTAFACFVPASIYGQIPTAWGTLLNINGLGVSHGKGDFVIAQSVNGVPNLQDRYVVNGVVFGRTYNNSGFSKYLKADGYTNISISELPKIWGVVRKGAPPRPNAVFAHLVKDLGGDKLAFDSLMITLNRLNIGLSEKELRANLESVLYVLRDIKLKYNNTKFDFYRTIDGLRLRDYRISIDYDLHLDRDYMGYLTFTKDGVDFATWLLLDQSSDPCETTISYKDFSFNTLMNHFSSV